ncbi:hypothetical protein GDO81_029609 [Engystomops pustulosus]|uniref:Uncharacterized protein n=1 Tax=Engystomops pustulosus TaxID=76066 RepID=A0AAV6YDD4_ENGPU|nr:hypothetical protein GDO81_029609 [Engystomops pustulosus]
MNNSSYSAHRLRSAAQNFPYQSLFPMGLTIQSPTSMFRSVGGNRRKSTQTRREHTNSLQMLTLGLEPRTPALQGCNAIH